MLLMGVTVAMAQSRKITSFDNDWRFMNGDVAEAQSVMFNDTKWCTLNVPHDWSIEGENLRENPGGGSIGFFPMGTGWYRKSFSVPGGKLIGVENGNLRDNVPVYI